MVNFGSFNQDNAFVDNVDVLVWNNFSGLGVEYIGVGEENPVGMVLEFCG
jgi:hypothetical protein